MHPSFSLSGADAVRRSFSKLRDIAVTGALRTSTSRVQRRVRDPVLSVFKRPARSAARRRSSTMPPGMPANTQIREHSRRLRSSFDRLEHTPAPVEAVVPSSAVGLEDPEVNERSHGVAVRLVGASLWFEHRQDRERDEVVGDLHRESSARERRTDGFADLLPRRERAHDAVVPRCQGLRGSAQNTGMPVSILNAACADSSLPRSQVSDRRRCSGSELIADARAFFIVTAP